MSVIDWRSEVPTAEAVLAYVGIVAANCSGRSRLTDRGIEAITRPVLFEDSEYYIRLNLIFSANYKVEKAVLEQADGRLDPRFFSESDFRQFKVIGKESSL